MRSHRCSLARPARLLALLSLLLSTTARAATFNIANNDVAGLKSALATANTNNQDDTINLAASGTYTLTTVDNTSFDPTGLPILDNDPLPSLKISDAPALNEGDSGTHNALFMVTRTSASGRTVTVNYATANGTATADSDYLAARGTLTFVPGQTSKTLPIQVLGDATLEPDAGFKVNLTGASFATISDAQGVHTITNDDASQ